MNVEIAQRLAELRREKGYSQEELAEAIGLSRQAVSKWERAESSPDTGNLVALAKLYGVTLDDLLRVDSDIEDDVKFENTDRSVSAEAQVKAAAEQAAAAAVQAQAAAAQAQEQVQQAQAQQAQATQQAQAQTQAAPQPQYYTQAPPPNPQQASVVPPASAPAKKEAGPWTTFPYPVLCVIVFLFAGFFFSAWHPAWVVFVTIPLYYWIAAIIENDPNYRK